jgi:hypothetical protein
MVLPVTLDSSNPENFDINWDEVPTHREASRQRADQTAAAMAAGDESDSGAIVEQLSEMFPGATIQVEGSSAGTLSPDAMDAIRSALGGEAGTSADDGDDDRIKALERLAKLHQAGALTDEEFAAEKSRLLGG